MKIVVIEIKKPICIPSEAIKGFCDNFARFCQEYTDSWIILIPEKVISDGHAELFLNDYYDIRVETLNNFAFSRLITNLEAQHPEVSLIMMGASDESKLYKVRKRIQYV